MTNTNGYIYSMFQFGTQSNQYRQNWSFAIGGINGASINFQSNLWYQIVLTYSPTNVAIYTNGVFLASACDPPIVVAIAWTKCRQGIGRSTPSMCGWRKPTWWKCGRRRLGRTPAGYFSAISPMASGCSRIAPGSATAQVR